ncbi:hypothetical protein C0Q64_11110 [Streptomyces albidoflavus]|nr:hypothetical protein C0Q64_11110 [Streptomyces albidoflavus]RZE03661.1 hypothetical protein C0Q65_11440 [Streptomyces albidoflavus]
MTPEPNYLGRWVSESMNTHSSSQAIITRHLCMAADAEKYSRLDTPGQEALQADLVRVLEEAAMLSGLDRTTWERQPKGDEEFAVLPADTQEPLVLGRFVRHLAVRIGERNANRAEGERMRLRLAIDFGVARTAALGHSGPAPVSVARYLNADQLKRVLEKLSSTDLVVIVSDRVYQDVVRFRGDGQGLDPARYVKVHVRKKEFSGYGWIHVPEHTREELEPLVADPEPDEPVVPAHTTVVKDNKDGVFHFGSGDAARTMHKKYYR